MTWAGALLAAAVTLGAAGGYGPPERRCGFADARIDESSGVASASWEDGVVWTHNDSGDSARFFLVDGKSCMTLATFDIAGVEAVDWEDMARTGTTLHFADIGDNGRVRKSVVVHDVAEPARGAPDGLLKALGRRTFTYPDGAHDAETLLADPTTGRLVVVTKDAGGTSTFYRAPAEGDGALERVADVAFSGITQYERMVTGGDATKERLVLRTYLAAAEWEIRPGDSLAAALARRPAPVTLSLEPQGEAIAYTTDGSGLWTTSESEGGPVHRLGRLGAPVRPQGVADDAGPADGEPAESAEAADGTVADSAGDDWPKAAAAAGAFALLALGGVVAFRRRHRPRPP